ncbi:MAG: hypothetical protein ACXVA0_23975 [Mucilaginibacter sp.]
MNDLNEAKTKAAAAYNAASDLFDHPANTFWDRFGRNTINRLDLKPGASVLDGSGASVLPAAEQVGYAGPCYLASMLQKNCLALPAPKRQT